jgi:hypothetical protein
MVVTVILGFVAGNSLGVGMAAVFRYIPDYFPSSVGAVGGIVGAMGGLGGFFLPQLSALAKVRTGSVYLSIAPLGAAIAAAMVLQHFASRSVDKAAARSDQGVFNMNANPELNVDLQYLAYSKSDFAQHTLWRIFAMDYHDGRTGLTKTDNRPLAIRQADHKDIRLGTYGADILATVPAGPGSLDFTFWGVIQNGNWGVLNQHAGAAGWKPATNWPRWLPIPGCAEDSFAAREIRTPPTASTILSSRGCPHLVYTLAFRSTT